MVKKRKKNGAPAPSLSVGWSDGDQDIIDFLDSTTRATGLSKTTLVKNALRVYAQRVKEDGKIQKSYHHIFLNTLSVHT